jgi:hypothetical protein
MAQSNDIAQLVPLLLDNFDVFLLPRPISSGMSFDLPQLTNNELESKEPESTAVMMLKRKKLIRTKKKKK